MSCKIAPLVLHGLSEKSQKGTRDMAATITDFRRREGTPDRWQRALERAKLAGVQVRQLQGSGQWLVTSASDPIAAYETDGNECSCPAAMLGGDPVCLHRAAYRSVLSVLQHGSDHPSMEDRTAA